ncbi:MFS transporter [Weissella cibaria]|uniref:MFS transporter n=1 Tax=Weissella cibaria TaxID=137591 RepID=UPI001C1F9CDF|nr:MFS transporter [Weissella cibaria]MBU7561577.1 MFS transporter [Weissella cibaria]
MFKTRNAKLTVFIILLSYFMTLLDNSIIFTGTAKMAADMNMSPSTLAWVQNAYALTYGGLLLIGGRLGDIFGRKRLFVVALSIFGLGSLLVGLAQTSGVLIVARAFQGIGASSLAPTTLALLMDSFEGQERTQAVAWYGSVAGIGASLGLVIGGVFATYFSWRDGFFINVPIAIIMILLAITVLPKSATQNGRFDFMGTVLSMIGMFSLVYAVNGASQPVLMLVIAFVALILFVLTENRASSPIMPLRLFHDCERVGGYIARLFYMGGMLGFWFLTPQLMQNVLHFTPLASGIGFFPLTVLNFIVALQVPKVLAKYGNRRVLIVGISITALGMLGVMQFNESLGYLLGISIPMVFLGIGQGLAFSPMTNVGIANADVRDAGAASGVVNVMHQVGGSLGMSLMVTIGSLFNNTIVSYRVAILVAFIFMIIALIAAVVLIKEQK